MYTMGMDVFCGKCGAKMATIKILKPMRDVVSSMHGTCPSCGHELSPVDFVVDVRKGE